MMWTKCCVHHLQSCQDFCVPGSNKRNLDELLTWSMRVQRSPVIAACWLRTYLSIIIRDKVEHYLASWREYWPFNAGHNTVLVYLDWNYLNIYCTHSSAGSVMTDKHNLAILNTTTDHWFTATQSNYFCFLRWLIRSEDHWISPSYMTRITQRTIPTRMFCHARVKLGWGRIKCWCRSLIVITLMLCNSFILILQRENSVRQTQNK